MELVTRLLCLGHAARNSADNVLSIKVGDEHKLHCDPRLFGSWGLLARSVFDGMILDGITDENEEGAKMTESRGHLGQGKLD